MEAGVDDGSFVQIEGALRSAAWVGQVPWLYWLHDYLSPVIGNHLGITARHGSLRTFAMKEVLARKDRGSDRKDILSKLFKVHEEKGELFDENAVVSMATSNIFAGSDTTAISTRAILYYLLKNPESLGKLRDEIDLSWRGGRLSDPAKLSEADNMPYLQAVMYEALRLHPAVGMSLPRVVPPGGCEIGGKFLPAGVKFMETWSLSLHANCALQTVVGVNPWVVHRNREVFGEDVESFRPERWLGEETGDLRMYFSIPLVNYLSNWQVDRFFFAFGSGARMCLGRSE